MFEEYKNMIQNDKKGLNFLIKVLKIIGENI